MMVTQVAINGDFEAGAPDSYPVGMTRTFLVLAIFQMFHALNQRSNTDSIFTPGIGHNKALFGTMAASAVVLALIMLTPVLRSFFRLTTLTANEWLITLGLSLLPLILVEITKLLKRTLRSAK